MVKRVNFGVLGDGSIGLRVSKPGYNVATNPPDPTQLVFDSNWGAVLPIYYSTGVFSLANGATQTFNFPAALSYTPFFCWMLSLNGSLWYEMQGYASWGSGSGFYVLMGSVTASSISFQNKTGQTVSLFGCVFRQAL